MCFGASETKPPTFLSDSFYGFREGASAHPLDLPSLLNTVESFYSSWHENFIEFVRKKNRSAAMFWVADVPFSISTRLENKSSSTPHAVAAGTQIEFRDSESRSSSNLSKCGGFMMIVSRPSTTRFLQSLARFRLSQMMRS